MTVDEARALAERYLAEPLPRRWQHVQAVADLAEELAHLPDVDGDLLVSAAWLHDIGYSPQLTDHPVDGARFLRSLGARRRPSRRSEHLACTFMIFGIRETPWRRKPGRALRT